MHPASGARSPPALLQPANMPQPLNLQRKLYGAISKLQVFRLQSFDQVCVRRPLSPGGICSQDRWLGPSKCEDRRGFLPTGQTGSVYAAHL